MVDILGMLSGGFGALKRGAGWCWRRGGGIVRIAGQRWGGNRSVEETTPASTSAEPPAEPAPAPVTPITAVGGDKAEAQPQAFSHAEAPSLLNDRPFAKLAEFCVDLFDELDDASLHFDEARREVALHVKERLQEALLACGVEVIDQDAPFDRSLHQPIRKTSGVAPGDPRWRARIVSPGFKLERRVLRRARADVERVETGSAVTDSRQGNE